MNLLKYSFMNIAGEIDDYVDEWHKSNTTQCLRDYLGMTINEYALWIERPEALSFIIFACKHGINI
jgi:hypothetical protein